MNRTFYRLQYNTGELSCVIQDDKALMLDFAKIVSQNKRHYPIAIFTVKLKEA